MSDDHIEIQIDDADIQIDGAPSPRRVDPEQALNDLRKQLDVERARAAAAEQRANENANLAMRAQSETADTNLHLVSNAIESVKQNGEMLKANYKAAMSVGDFDAAADIQAEISTNAARLLQLEQGKSAIESAPKPEAPAPFVSDPVEAIARNMTPRSAAWIRSHPEFATDPKKLNRMIAAHNLAVSEDFVPDTDDYFAAVERTLKIGTSDSVSRSDDASADAARVTQRRDSPPPAAPTTRQGSASGSSPTVVRLSAAEREIAGMMGMTEKDYALNKIALQKEGKL